MDGLKYYEIPIKTAKLGLHEYIFNVDNEFFSLFEDSLIENGSFKIKVIMEKRETVIEFKLFIDGSLIAPCDRCLADIPILVNSEGKMLVKYDEIGREDEDEVMYVSFEEASINIAGLMYEFISLSIPISKTIDCEENDMKYCDEKVLEYYDLLEEEAERIAEEDKIEKNNIWDSLNDIKLN